MPSEIEIGDKVRVIRKNSFLFEAEGTILSFYSSYSKQYCYIKITKTSSIGRNYIGKNISFWLKSLSKIDLDINRIYADSF